MSNKRTQSPSDKDTQSITESVISTHRPRVICFYADWCGVCVEYKPVLENAIDVYNNSIDFQLVNIDDLGNAELVKEFNVTDVPTTVIFDGKGEQVFADAGSIDRISLNNMLESIYLQTINKPNNESGTSRKLGRVKTGAKTKIGKNL